PIRDRSYVQECCVQHSLNLKMSGTEGAGDNLSTLCRVQAPEGQQDVALSCLIHPYQGRNVVTANPPAILHAAEVLNTELK
ncbi:hypothetical protein, partial [Deinococcus soli (ex Cha et al. 2016)]|uniref:hypothetical protein n=1 Tax=Deinococcus soli (ex Cha et al. 2016) TaxID=1309411 RepID=UPI001E5BBD92